MSQWNPCFISSELSHAMHLGHPDGFCSLLRQITSLHTRRGRPEIRGAHAYLYPGPGGGGGTMLKCFSSRGDLDMCIDSAMLSVVSLEQGREVARAARQRPVVAGEGQEGRGLAVLPRLLPPLAGEPVVETVQVVQAAARGLGELEVDVELPHVGAEGLLPADAPPELVQRHLVVIVALVLRQLLHLLVQHRRRGLQGRPLPDRLGEAPVVRVEARDAALAVDDPVEPRVFGAAVVRYFLEARVMGKQERLLDVLGAVGLLARLPVVR
eukprot:CAMPEP_0179320614 /NCGR_PEP_ID=MMETSP0797-20121207/58145_1 /TAXON_ID=47934 /ORGANISM="Dinophysis acuminata, Strain DAEP01" /LENGTH=267 /DNA_ID=CAMNT_0021032129 /DNA_START=115 /DNA_END=914 /DNA_ORIENTATION=-